MRNEVRPQKVGASGTVPAGKFSMSQCCSSYGRPSGRNVSTGISAHGPRNPDRTHPPSPLPFGWGEWEGANILDRNTPGGGCYRSLTRGYLPLPLRGCNVPRYAREDDVTQSSSFLATTGLWVTISSTLKTRKRTGVVKCRAVCCDNERVAAAKFDHHHGRLDAWMSLR